MRFEDKPIEKKRPVIVLGCFPGGDVFAAKVTSQDIEARGLRAYRLDDWRSYGLKRMSWVRTQNRLRLHPEDFIRKIGSVPDDVAYEVELEMGGRPSDVTAARDEWIWL